MDVRLSRDEHYDGARAADYERFEMDAVMDRRDETF
jgi:hypothetical protein